MMSQSDPPAPPHLNHAAVVALSTDLDWAAARRSGIGASEAATIVLGRAHGTTPMALWLVKVGAEDPPDLDGLEYIQLGQELEPYVRERWMRETGRYWHHNRATYRSHAWPFMLATPDGFQLADDGAVEASLEGKTTGHLGRWDDGVPEVVRIQAQHQMAVTGLPRTSVAVLGGGPVLGFRWADVERDQEFIAGELVPALRAFWECVTSKTPPDVDDRVETSKALAALYAEVRQDAVVVLDGAEWLDLWEDLDAAKSAEKDAKARRTFLENKVRAAMGPAEVAALSGGRKFAWKRITAHDKPREARERTYRTLRQVQPKGW